MFEDYGDAILGGLAIGAAAVLLLFTVGYPVGISGFLSKAMTGSVLKAGWRLSFLAGMLLVAFVLGAQGGSGFVKSFGVEVWQLALGAFFVGAGARLAGGCTSGHSLCGMGRLDTDSIVATVVFIVSGAATVALFG
ncbi:MAG: YeeE/YedE thiosulfate transporter family protein [Verrucomicrobiota bacterium]